MTPESSALTPLVVVAGPTAAGKSALALDLAGRHHGAIVAADSRQIYRDFDIGTAKPTAEERARVPHEMLDVEEPTRTYTVARYQADARAAIARCRAAGRLPLLVGGTGFYIRAVLGGTPVPPVPPDPERRRRYFELPDLWERVKAVDPEAAARLHPNDRFRLSRALEVHEATGRPLSSFKAEPAPYDVVYLVVSPPREELQRRIARRVDAMLEAGWLAELDRIVDRYGPDLELLGTLGYAELMDFRAGAISLAEAKDRIARNTWRYARRQLTWFKRESEANWLEPGEAGKLVAERILATRLGR